MGRQGFGQKWVGDDSPEAEAAFRETLLRLRAEGASNQQIAEAVMGSPFILRLVWVVTARRRLKTGRGARPPFDWEEWLAKEPELRDEWRCETVYLLGRACQRNGMLRCDLDRPSVGGYWRVIIMYKAVKAAWNLWKESRLTVRHERRGREDVSVDCCDTREKDKDEVDLMDRGHGGQCRGSAPFADERHREMVMDLRLDLMRAIDELENPRQRAVMRLFLHGCTYQEIADWLTRKNGPGGARVTYEMVRGAFERAREILKERLSLLAA